MYYEIEMELKWNVRGVTWSSSLVHWIRVLMAESSECGFESWLRPWCLCPWTRHFTIVASLHPGYLWGHSWLLRLLSPICAETAAIVVSCFKHGVPWPSGLVHWICVLMTASSECGSEPRPRPWCLCRHWAIIYHNCFSPPRSKWVPVIAELVAVFFD